MPVWTATLPVPGLMSGVPVNVFDDEVVTDGQESQAVALPQKTGRTVDLSLDLTFDSAPTTVDYQIQLAMVNEDAAYFNAGTAITAVAGGRDTINNVVARFARVVATDADVEQVTAKLMVS